MVAGLLKSRTSGLSPGRGQAIAPTMDALGWRLRRNIVGAMACPRPAPRLLRSPEDGGTHTYHSTERQVIMPKEWRSSCPLGNNHRRKKNGSGYKGGV